MTDNEIIKSLKCCCGVNNYTCRNCSLYSVNSANCVRSLLIHSLEHVNHQKTEIERLRTENKLLLENSLSTKFPFCVLCGNGAILTTSLAEYDKLIEDISTKAIKNFAEKVKEKLQWDVTLMDRVVYESDIDKLMKERS